MNINILQKVTPDEGETPKKRHACSTEAQRRVESSVFLVGLPEVPLLDRSSKTVDIQKGFAYLVRV